MATNKPRRKTYSDEFKEFLVQEAISSGRSIASIARDNGINQNLLHNWKREQKAKPTKYPHLLTMTLTAIHQHSSLSV
ncbi:transposase, partial [Psychrobacter celer]